LDVKRFSEYFGNCPVKEIPVRTHPVSVYHSKTKVRMRREVIGVVLFSRLPCETAFFFGF
jgi:HrpA-like RNA helicase